MKITHNYESFSMENLGKVISSTRKEKNYTQGELAELLGVSHQAVSSWENGLTCPDITKIPELSNYLGISISTLFCDKSDSLVDVIEKVNDNEFLNEQELIEIAPICKPDLLNSLFDEIEIENINIESMLSLSPFVNSDRIYKWIIANQNGLDPVSFLPLFPFIESSQVRDYVNYIKESKDFSLSLIVPFAPYLQKDEVNSLFSQIYDLDELSSIEGLLPFVDVEQVNKTVIITVINEGIYDNQLVSLISYCDSETINLVYEYLESNNRLSELENLKSYLEIVTSESGE